VVEGKPHAGNSLVMAAGAQAEGRGIGSAYNELGLICFDGKIVNPNHARAAEFFAKAANMGDPNGALNVVSQFLLFGEMLSESELQKALTRLERLCAQGFEGPACWLLGRAYETGRGRPHDPARALAHYMRCDVSNPYAAKGIARLALTASVPDKVLAHAIPVLDAGRAAGDAESCWYLAFMHLLGIGVQRNEAAGRDLLEQACLLGAAKACESLREASTPAFSMPESISFPPLSSGYPLANP